MAVDTDELRDMANDCAEDGLHTMAEQLRADADEIDRLRRWKAEAIEVLTKWDAVHQALGSPGRPGQSKAAASNAEAMRLSDEIDRLRSQNNRMRHLLTGDVAWLTGSISFSPASAAARDRADRVSEAIRDLFAGDGA